jgi:amidase
MTETTDQGLHYMPLSKVAGLLRRRETSSVALTQAILDRIDTIDSRLKSYATVMGDQAMSAAAAADAEISAEGYRGPLHGIPIAVKDLCYTQGTRTMGGTRVKRGFVPEHDATVVSKLEQAGAVFIGKLNLTEGAMAGYHPDFDIPINPWREELWSGASSSGSGVAVAAGLCYASLGSDTGGSIRFPSMANGVVGLKPTYGRVSRHGVLPLAETLDHIGPMTRSVADAAIVLQAISGHDTNDSTSLNEPVPDMIADIESGVAGMRIGFDRDFSSDRTDPALVAAIDKVLDVYRQLGADVVEVSLPDEIAEMEMHWFEICSSEAYRAHIADFTTRPDDFGPFFRDFLEIGESVTDEQLAIAADKRLQFNHRFETVLDTVDAILCPSGGVTFDIPAGIQYGDRETLQPLFDVAQMNQTIPADFAGTPTLTMPCGFAPNNAPYAFQLMGKRLSEATLFRIGRAYEDATEWHLRHPTM